MDLDCISDIISQIRMKYSGPILTHIMLGFDFETIEDIEQTASFLQKNFDNTSIHQFSPRPNTKLCNLNINKNIEKHEIIIRNVRTLIRTQYLKKILTNISKVTPQKVQKEKEYRFSAQKVPLEVITKLKSLNWSMSLKLILYL
ncbi:hypothetical protein AGMMS49525_17690 [Bacteroidia bacterium]|nr:hypothetical protein AGMMS49525_17690 [Bacteroidia bacterium]